MTDAERQAIEAAVIDHPKMQAALRTLWAWDAADRIGDAVLVAVTKQYCAELLNSGHSIDEVNAMLPAFIKDVQAQRQLMLTKLRRFLDEPRAADTLQ
jgi:hypothetical protein